MGFPYVYDIVFMRDQGIHESTIGLIVGLGNDLLITATLIRGKVVDRSNAYKLVISGGAFGMAMALCGFFIFFFSRRLVALGQKGTPELTAS